MNICPAMCNEELFKTILFEQLVINFHYYEKNYDLPSELIKIWDTDKILFEIIEKIPTIYFDDLIDDVPTKLFDTEQFKNICEDIFSKYRATYISRSEKAYFNAFSPSELAHWLFEWIETDNRFKLYIDSFEKRRNVIEKYYLNSIIEKPINHRIQKI